MVVLVVDDQTYVVGGIVSGVRWDKIRVSKVLKAYNAPEAKEILENQAVDIILCDIEMPAEDGLSLFKWVKGRGFDAECIFLTAHADFLYAKEALKLGGFDYILQPARYEDIEDAILRAMDKIKCARERRELASFGQIFHDKKDKMLKDILGDLCCADEADIEPVLEDLRKLDICIHQESRIHIVLARVISSGAMRPAQLKDALRDASAGLFDGYDQKVILSELEKGKYVYLIYSERGLLIDSEGLVRQVDQLIRYLRDDHDCRIACYAGESLLPQEIPSRMTELFKMDEDNVALAGKTFILRPNRDPVKEPGMAHLFKKWASMLLNDAGPEAHDEIRSHLQKLADDGQLDAESLRRFHHQFLQMVFSVAAQKKIPVQHIFQDSGGFDDAYLTMNRMLDFISYVMAVLSQNDTETDDRDQVDKIIKYVVDNIDDDIRREDIAREVFLNPDYLSRIFKREVGISLKEFITQTKMKRARSLIRTTTMQISMVAIKVGYTNFSHFSQVYKKSMGLSPIEERERERKEASCAAINHL